MKQCSIADLKPGMVLGQSLYAYYGTKRTLLLGVKAKFSAPIIKKLESYGFSSLYIEEGGTEDVIPEDALSDETRDNALLDISGYYENIHSIIKEKLRKENAIEKLKSRSVHFELPAVAPLKASIKNIIQDLFFIGSMNGYHTISGISRSNAIHNHVLNVTVLSLLLGNEFGFIDSEQKVLGMGALLHDIGKAMLPGIYEKRYWELDTSEHPVMREHPMLGVQLLEGLRTVSEAERQIIVQHHERQDGTGHPYGLTGDNLIPVRTQYTRPNQIFRFAEIVTVADMYDNLVSGNFYQHRFSPEEALGELFREAGTVLNKEIVRALSSVVNLYPVASNVKIEKHPDPRLVGSRGVVALSDGPDSDVVEVIVLYSAAGKRVPEFMEKIFLDQHESFKLAVDR